MESVNVVLLVDDEPLVQELCRLLLQRVGIEVLAAYDGMAAVEMFQKHRSRIGLVILDWMLPRFSGDDTFRMLTRIEPEIRVLFCSGYPPEQIRSIGDPRVVGYIAKPFHSGVFVTTVQQHFDCATGAIHA